MPTPRVECRHCRKLVIAIDLFSHLNAKHPEALWTQSNKAEIEKALTRSCETHNIALKIDGETYYYSPFSNRLYSTVPKYLSSKNKILKPERAVRWCKQLKKIAQSYSPPSVAVAVAPAPPGVECHCAQILILIELLREQGSAVELPKNLPGCVVDGYPGSTKDSGVGATEDAADEDD